MRQKAECVRRHNGCATWSGMPAAVVQRFTIAISNMEAITRSKIGIFGISCEFNARTYPEDGAERPVSHECLEKHNPDPTEDRLQRELSKAFAPHKPA